MSTALDSVAELLLDHLRQHPGHQHSVADLCPTLKIDHDTLIAAVDRLAEWEYQIERHRHTIAFISAPDLLTDIEIINGLTTRRIGRRCHAYNSVKSTNDLAADLAAKGAEHGTIVTAERQTMGRGRLGRLWHSPPRSGVYVSIILKPSFGPRFAPATSIVTAVALADVFSEYVPGEAQIKWPNDVWLGGRKAAGILTELSAERDRINHIVVGVGMNINLTVDQIPDDLRSVATSLQIARQKITPRVELLQKFLFAFEQAYSVYAEDRLAPMQEKIRRYSLLIGSKVAIRTGKKVVEGTAVDIDAEGRLMLQTDAETIPITAGEVTVLRREQQP